MQEGKGGTYRKKLEKHAGRKGRNIQEGNGKTQEGNLETYRKAANMQIGNGGAYREEI
jgi:hypothetical protein